MQVSGGNARVLAAVRLHKATAAAGAASRSNHSINAVGKIQSS